MAVRKALYQAPVADLVPLFKIRVTVCSDNQGTLENMISGSLDNECGSLLVNRARDLLHTMCVNAWFERVNTASNIADPPSRGADLEGLGKRFEVDALRIAKEAISSWD